MQLKIKQIVLHVEYEGSFDNSDRNASVAFSQMFSFDGVSTVIIGLSGDARISEHVKLIGEVWFVGSDS